MDLTILILSATHTEGPRELPLDVLASDAPQKMNGALASAQSHYLSGRYRDCFAECLAAIECALMDVSDEHGWPARSTENVRWLTDRCVSERWIPAFAKPPLLFLQTYLEEGAFSNDGRGTLGGAQDELAARYALHLSAVTLILLADAGRPGITGKPFGIPARLIGTAAPEGRNQQQFPPEPRQDAA